MTLPPEHGEDAGRIQSVGSRLARGEITIDEVNDLGCRACATPGGGCQFLGTAATAQVVAEALGLTLPHAALAPSGQPVWRDMALRSGRAVVALEALGITGAEVLTPAAVENAMIVHAAFGGSTNLLLHVPAIAHAAGLRRPAVDDWDRVNRQVPRLVDVLPNGPRNHPTVRVFLAGGVPEVMLHLRAMGLLDLDAMTATGRPLGDNLDWWEHSERRRRMRDGLRAGDGVDPDDVIHGPDGARAKGLTSTVCFPAGNLAPEGSVVKSTAIDPGLLDEDGVYRLRGPARVFTTERGAMAAIKEGRIAAGEVMVLLSCGPLGTGMEEIAQVTIALKYWESGGQVALLTDARFSGFSSGPCIGHVGPEALAGGPVGRLVEGDVVEVRIDTRNLKGRIDLVGHGEDVFGAEEGARVLAGRDPRPDLAPEEELPDDTRLWAALQQAGGGTWGGCVYDPDEIVRLLDAGRRAAERGQSAVSGSKSFVVGVTGASGALYAARTLRALLASGHHVHLVMSRYGRYVMHEELGWEPDRGADLRLPGAHRGGGGAGGNARGARGQRPDADDSPPARRRPTAWRSCRARSRPSPASPAAPRPTSSSASADVSLKEKRPLVLVVRETPLNLIHLRNLVTAAEAGAAVVPAMPAFYQKPRTLRGPGGLHRRTGPRPPGAGPRPLPALGGRRPEISAPDGLGERTARRVPRAGGAAPGP